MLPGMFLSPCWALVCLQHLSFAAYSVRRCSLLAFSLVGEVLLFRSSFIREYGMTLTLLGLVLGFFFLFLATLSLLWSSVAFGCVCSG